MHDLEIKIIRIKGNCPVFEIGDCFEIKEGFKLNTDNLPNICMHALSSIFPYYSALSRGIKGSELGLNKENNKNKAFVQCLDPCEYTDGGTVVFKITPIEK